MRYRSLERPMFLFAIQRVSVLWMLYGCDLIAGQQRSLFIPEPQWNVETAPPVVNASHLSPELSYRRKILTMLLMLRSLAVLSVLYICR